MNIMELHGVSAGYDRRAVLAALDLRIARGSLIAIVGPNGAGKSTLLRTLAGELRPMAGTIVRHEPAMAWLPQQSTVDRSFPIDVRAFVAMGLWSRLGAFGRFGREARLRVDMALDRIGLRAMAAHPIGTLSGGQMQRALFARLWLQDAALILMDEPFTAIDAATEADLMAVVRDWHATGRTQLAVLHDLQLVRRHFPHTLLVSAGTIAFGPTGEVLAPRQLARAGMGNDLRHLHPASGHAA